MTILDKLYDFNDTESQEQICVLYIDFAKAFDIVSLDLLIGNMAIFGICGKPLKLFASFLTDRIQFVQINDLKSNWRKENSGVPQGSILGPLFFLKSIDDLPDVIPQADNFGYAVDHKALFSAHSGLDRAVNTFAIWLKEKKCLLTSARQIL